MRGIYLVTDSALCGRRGVLQVVLAGAKAGVCAVQLREKDLCTRDFVTLAKNVRQVLSEFKVPLIINDRVDVALAAGADGVHLGRSDMGISEARALLGPGAIIGLSLENLSDLQELEDSDASYLAVSPLFVTPTKTDAGTPWGLEGLREARKLSRHALAAIGGIDASNALEVAKAGADCLAVVSAICAAEDPFAATSRLCEIFKSA